MINLKDKLHRRELTIGSWLTFGYASIAEIMASAGFEWLTVDMEHSAITIEQSLDLIRVIELSGAVPLVRVGENSPLIIKRVMDAGAYGVIVPMVNSRVEAEAAVNAVKYPPVGTRGVGLARAQKYGFGFSEYARWLKNESVVIVQIEHIKAIENLEAILSVPGVDGSIIGPYDLSGSLGYPGAFERQDVQDALKKYEEICDKLNKPKGFHVVQPDSSMVKLYRDKGYVFIAAGVDMLYLGNKCSELIKDIF